MVKFLYVRLSSPCFTAIKEGGKNDSLVYIDFGCLRDSTPILHIPTESAKGCTRFCEYGVHLHIYDDRVREGAAEVGELFYHLQLLTIDGDVGLDVWLSGCWLVHHFRLFCADG